MADDFNQKLIRVESILMSFCFNIMEISLNAIDFKTFFLLSFSFCFVQGRGGHLPTTFTHDSKAFWLYSERTDATQETSLFIIDSIKST